MLMQLIQLTPSGPYILGGYCSGGLLAFAIAERLIAHHYPGNIAFLPFKDNQLIAELSRLKIQKY